MSLYYKMLLIPFLMRAKVASVTRIIVNSITCGIFEATVKHLSVKESSGRKRKSMACTQRYLMNLEGSKLLEFSFSYFFS